MLNTINVDLIISFVMRAELEWHKWIETTMLFIISLKHFGGFQPDSSIQKTRSDLTWLYKSRQNLSRLHSKKRFQPTGISPLCSHYTDTDLKGRKSPLAFRAGALPSQAYWYTWLSELVMCVCGPGITQIVRTCICLYSHIMGYLKKVIFWLISSE